MKSELKQIIQLLSKAEASPSSIMRRSVLVVGSFTLLLFASKGIAEASLLALPSMPASLRGGYINVIPSIKSTTSASTPQESTKRRDRSHGRPRGGKGGGLVALQRTIDDIGNKIQVEAIVKQWSGLQDNMGREWFKLLSNIEKMFPLHQHSQHHHRRRRSITSSKSSSKLDDVLHAFQSVLTNESEVDTAQLLKACRAHLTLMKSGGSALRVVAKDMEANLIKAESLFQNLPKENRRYLTSLLKTEISSGIHDGNVLEDSSAAMGLLWIRRSLAFQLDLYASLISSSSAGGGGAGGGGSGRHPVHPKDAALLAYDKALSPYHGWILQKVFPLSFSQMPDRQVFIAKFGGREVEDLDEEYEKEIVQKLKMLVMTWEPIIDTWTKEFERLNLEDTRRV